MKKSDLIWVMETLGALYPDATTELHYSTPFQLLVAVILSAQATDKQVNKVTATFFDTIRRPEDILALGYETWESSIKSIGLYRSKAKNIWRLCLQLQAASNKLQDVVSSLDVLDEGERKVYEDWGYVIPRDIRTLMQLPGVGEKTAKVVAHVLYNEPVIAVDTHVHRVCNRLGIITTKQPLQTSKLLEKKIPDDYKRIAHHCFILFGRYHCVARKPKCDTCPVSKVCRYYKKLEGKSKKGKEVKG